MEAADLKHRHWAGLLLLSCLATGSITPRALAAPPRKKAPSRRPTPAPAKPTIPPVPPHLKDAASLQLLPTSAALEGAGDQQRVIAVATLKDGTTYDVTETVTFVVADPKKARITNGVVFPVADGDTRLTARLGSLVTAPTTIAVRNAATPAQPEFVNDIEPILAKAGCNATACHGSPAGKGGLKLSLFGYEPEVDHSGLVKDADGKRVDLKNPENSLLLRKPTNSAPHAGGQRFKQDSAEYRTILAWLKAGAPGLGEFEARVQRVDVIPSEPWLPKPDSRQRLLVTAQMSDGTTRDVTEKVLFTSNDDAIAAVDQAGIVTAKRAGETAVMVRYLGQVGVARVAVLPPWKIDRYPAIAGNNYIDTHVLAKLQKLRTVPSDLCSDSEFIRRATLDVCGLVPSSTDVRQFLLDKTPNKRSKLIDQLLERGEFVDLWTMKWNDTLRNNPRLTRRGLGSYHRWIREQVAKNRPYDEFVRDLITASGRNVTDEASVSDLPPQLANRPNAQFLVDQINRAAPNAAANYFVVSRDPLDVTSATSQMFLGVRIECARCHNHPFEKWTQNDFYSLASFFSGIQVRGQNQVPQVVSFNPRSPGVRHPKTNEVVEPKTLDGAEVKPAAGEDRRSGLATWLTSPENPYFAKAIANRVWGHYFGRGIVDPVDDFRATNPASNPELLGALGKDLVEHRFDLKHLHRTILNSRTYQQSSKPNLYNREDTSNFARFYPKRMMAEQLYDSISQATGVFLQAPGAGGRRPLQALGVAGQAARALADALPEGPITRSMQLPVVAGANARVQAGGLGQFLNAFGKPRREVVCECERSSEGNVNQALFLINGPEVNLKIAAPRGRVQSLVRSGANDAQVLEELYLATLARYPSSEEVVEAQALLRAGRNRAEAVEDLMWGLLNSREFLFNH